MHPSTTPPPLRPRLRCGYTHRQYNHSEILLLVARLVTLLSAKFKSHKTTEMSGFDRGFSFMVAFTHIHTI